MVLGSGVQCRVRAIIACLSAIAAALTMVAVAPEAHATNRAYLRPDATGRCEWDPIAYWVQRCDVYSPAMNTVIVVQVQPAKNGGNAGFYLLDGGRAEATSSAWLAAGNAQARFVNDNITIVMPAGGGGSFYTNWVREGRPGDPSTNYKWETFLTRELPDYLQRHFGVSPTNNAIGGLSMGATAAMNLAAAHPQQFRQVTSFSGYLTIGNPVGYVGVGLTLWELGKLDVNAMYGSMFSPRVHELDPLANIPRLRGKDIYLSAATGIWGPSEAHYALNDRIVGTGLELAAAGTTLAWEAAARAQGLQVTSYYAPVGSHNWEQWNLQLERARPHILNVMNAWG